MHMPIAIFVLAIVAITSFRKVLIARYFAMNGKPMPDRISRQMKRGYEIAAQGHAEAHFPNQREAELQREVEDLRERIKVLERITTDGHRASALSDEIESLRGK